MRVTTKFVVPPADVLHVGAARTALFNWLFARHHGGRFHLRIESEDHGRSTPEARGAIIDTLSWLGLDWDGEPKLHSARVVRHRRLVECLLAKGRAYRCYTTAEELAAMRETARAAGRSARYDGRWRHRDSAEAPVGVQPVVRLKATRHGETVIDDLVQGRVTVANGELDDMVLLRADGSPTYMLAAVVDDHDLGITHVIRGDDHLTDTFRQYQLYKAIGWQSPEFAHIPLIHGPDGAKLSRRQSILALEAYREQGFLPEAMCNYLLRLGWSHGGDEIIDREQAIRCFDLVGISRSPARFDANHLLALNAHYLRQADDGRLATMILARLSERPNVLRAATAKSRLLRGMASLKQRAKTIDELTEMALFYVIDGDLPMDPRATRLLTPAAQRHLARVSALFADLEPWTADELEAQVRDYAESNPGLTLAAVVQLLRVATTGSTVSPPIFEAIEILGRDETLRRSETPVQARTPPLR